FDLFKSTERFSIVGIGKKFLFCLLTALFCLLEQIAKTPRFFYARQRGTSLRNRKKPLFAWQKSHCFFNPFGMEIQKTKASIGIDLQTLGRSEPFQGLKSLFS